MCCFYSVTRNYFEGSLSTGISDIIQGFFPNKKLLLSRTRFNKLAPWRSIWSHLAHQNRARVWVMLSEGKHETQFSANGNMKREAGFNYMQLGYIWEGSCLHILVLFITHRVHLWNFLACVWTPLSWVTVTHNYLCGVVSVEQLLCTDSVLWLFTWPLLLVWNNCCVQTACYMTLVVERGPETLPCSLLVSHAETVFRIWDDVSCSRRALDVTHSDM